MANLILASKREVKSGALMWHVYLQENGVKNAESDFYFSLPIKALKYAFLLRKRSGGIIPKAIYTKLMADVSASKAQAEQAAPQEQSAAPEAEQAAEPSALAKAYESMKAKHPDAILLYRCGDFYESFGEDAKAVSEVLGITLTRTSAKDITAQQAAFPAASLDTYLPKIVRAGKRVAICDEPQQFTESAPKKKAARKSAKKESKLFEV